jgi:hypothetical protein
MQPVYSFINPKLPWKIPCTTNVHGRCSRRPKVGAWL